MKKILTTLIFICCIQAIYAQLYIGTRGGVLAGAPIPTEIDSASSGGFVAKPFGGLTMLWKFHSKWGIQTEVYYARKVSTYESYVPKTETTVVQVVWGIPTAVKTSYEGTVKGKIDMQYYEVPLMLTFDPIKRLRLMAGGYFSQVIAGADSGHAKLVIGNNFSNVNNYYDNYNGIKKADVGVMGGVSVLLPKGFHVDLRMQRGLRTFYKEGFLSSQGQKEQKMFQTYAQVGIGYQFEVAGTRKKKKGLVNGLHK